MNKKRNIPEELSEQKKKDFLLVRHCSSMNLNEIMKATEEEKQPWISLSSSFENGEEVKLESNFDIDDLPTLTPHLKGLSLDEKVDLEDFPEPPTMSAFGKASELKK